MKKKSLKKFVLSSVKTMASLGLVLGFTCVSFAEMSPEAQVAFENAKKDIRKFQMVDENKIYTGGRPQPQDLVTLKKLGVKTIINLQGGDYDLFGPSVLYFEPGEATATIRQERTTAMNLRIGWYPFRLSTFAYVDQGEQNDIRKILAMMNDPKMQPVFIHCELGQDRTGLIAALYEVFSLGEKVATAHARWVALGHSGRLNQLTTWELDNYFYAATSTRP